jgi:hypothetical protein
MCAVHTENIFSNHLFHIHVTFVWHNYRRPYVNIIKVMQLCDYRSLMRVRELQTDKN